MANSRIWSFPDKTLSYHPLSPNSRNNFKDLRVDLKNATEKGLIPGCVIVVAEQGEIKWAESFGSRQILPDREDMTLDTVFDLASLTKVVATLPAILHLVEEGLISLESCLKDYFIESKNKPIGKVTIAQLLTHTSGLSARTYLKQYGEVKNEMIKGILTSSLENEIGEKVSYSNRGFIILGEIIEKVSGESLHDYVQKHIWSKLEMKETLFNPYDSDYILRTAPTEYREEINGCLRGTVHDENASALGGIAGHAGVFSTANDLVKLCNMLMSKGDFKGNQILNKHLVTESMKNHTKHLGESRGLGWDFFSTENTENEIIGHLGFTGTSVWLDPIKEVYCIFLTNRVHPSRESLHIRNIRSTVINKVFN